MWKQSLDSNIDKSPTSSLRDPRQWYQPFSTLPEAPTRRRGWLTGQTMDTTFPSNVFLVLNQMLGVPPPTSQPLLSWPFSISSPSTKHRAQHCRAYPHFSTVITGTPFCFHSPSTPHTLLLPASVSCPIPLPFLPLWALLHRLPGFSLA